MNPALAKTMAAADAAMARTGETQPAEQDGRAVTSQQNGARGGRPEVDYIALARAYQMERGIVRWDNEFFQYDARLGAYRRLGEKKMGAAAGNWMGGDTCPLRYTANAETNLVRALRRNFDPALSPPCFTDTGASAAGWISMRNGLLSVEAAARGEAGALTAHSATFFSTHFLPYDWDPTATCPRFMRFLGEALPDPEAQEMARMLGGLLLVPDCSFNVFFVLLGEGGCGKSTFLKILGAMLGEENVCAVPLYMIAEKHTSHRLTRCLANLVDDSATVDTTRGQSLAGVEGVLKQVTSGARIHCEPKGIDPWEAPATARCVFCQNPPLPAFVDRSEAIWDRLRVIPFPMRFRGTEGQNPRLAEEIVAEELPGVFRWAVGGLGALRTLKQFPQSKAGAAIVAEHRGTCDREAAFLQDRYTYTPGAFTPSADIRRAYVAWCEAEGYRPKNAANFAQDVRRLFPQVTMENLRLEDERKRGFWNLGAIPGEDGEE